MGCPLLPYMELHTLLEKKNKKKKKKKKKKKALS